MWTIIIALITIGLLLILLEILVIPGGGVVGIIGFFLTVVGVYLSFKHHGVYAGSFVLSGTVIFNVIALVLALRSKTWDRAMLKTNIDSRVNTIDSSKLKVGDQGVTVSRCAPAGKALIHGDFLEVQTRSEFIDENSTIEIIKLEGNKIFVKLKN